MLAARASAVAALTVLVTVAVQQLVARPLLLLAHAGARAVSDRDPTALVLPLDELVLIGAAAALAACWLWLMLGVMSAALAVLASRFAGRPTRARRIVASPTLRLGPRGVRALTVVALGVSSLQAPARAETGGEQTVPAVSVGVLSGLPLPDRAVASAPRKVPPPSRPSATTARTVVVTPGDSLWSIAAGLLPADAVAGEVDRAWRRLAAANAEALGPDPDLIFPGTVLQVPPLDHPPREERS